MGNRRIVHRTPLISGWHLILFGACIAALGFRYLLSDHPNKIEYGYSRMIYPWLANLLSWPARLVPAPYSATELLLYPGLFAGILGTLIHLRRARKQRKPISRTFVRLFFHWTAVAAGLFALYLGGWAYNYLRLPYSAVLNPEVQQMPTHADYSALGREMILLLNHIRPKIAADLDARDLDSIEIRVDHAVRKSVSITGLSHIPNPPETKELLADPLLSMLGITGFFSPFLMEPHVNGRLMHWEQPWVRAHEKAHFMGFASETDANLIAYVSCLGSPDDLLQYSGALNALLDLRGYIPEEKWKAMINEGLSEAVKGDIRRRSENIRQYRRQYARWIALRRKVNDTYLKLNDQPLGMASYRAAVPHLTIWWEKGLRRSSVFSCSFR